MRNATEALNDKEYNVFYKRYIELVPNKNIVQLLIDDLYNQLKFIESIPANKLGFRYAPNKWSVADVILHIVDTERIFSYRALWFARNDQHQLPGFDENFWVKNSNADRYLISDLIGQFKTTRNQTIALFKGFNEADLLKTGVASNADFSIRAIAYIILGHNRHHINKIKELYLR